jgi:hypothetical protein
MRRRAERLAPMHQTDSQDHLPAAIATLAGDSIS